MCVSYDLSVTREAFLVGGGCPHCHCAVGTGLCWLWVELQLSCPEINLTVGWKKVSFWI